MTLMSAASANSSGGRRIISLMIPMELSMRGATGFAARALCISVPKSLRRPVFTDRAGLPQIYIGLTRL